MTNGKGLERAGDVVGRGEVEAFLEAVRRVPARAGGGGVGRLVFALDATASRQPAWDRAAEVQGQMFLEAGRLGGLEVQLVFYRGLGECRASRWTGDAAHLARLMTGVSCRAGRTQVGRVLRHAAAEAGRSRVHALAFVGDALEEGLDGLAPAAGELALRGVRAFMFQEGHDPEVERGYREVARLTGGAWCRFDAAAPARLRELLGAVAAYAAGGLPALRDAAARGSGELRRLAGQVG